MKITDFKIMNINSNQEIVYNLVAMDSIITLELLAKE
jgi:hypothetical protein